MKRKLLPIAIVGVAILVSVAMHFFSSPPPKAKSPDTAVAVKTILLHRTQAKLAVESQGTVEPIFGDQRFHYVTTGLQEGDQLVISALGVPIEGMKLSPELVIDKPENNASVSDDANEK